MKSSSHCRTPPSQAASVITAGAEDGARAEIYCDEAPTPETDWCDIGRDAKAAFLRPGPTWDTAFLRRRTEMFVLRGQVQRIGKATKMSPQIWLVFAAGRLIYIWCFFVETRACNNKQLYSAFESQIRPILSGSC